MHRLKRLKLFSIFIMIFGMHARSIHAQDINLGGLLNGLIGSVQQKNASPQRGQDSAQAPQQTINQQPADPSESKTPPPESDQTNNSSHPLTPDEQHQQERQMRFDEYARLKTEVENLPITPDGYKRLQEVENYMNSSGGITTIYLVPDNKLIAEYNSVISAIGIKKPQFKDMAQSIQKNNLNALLSKYKQQIGNLDFPSAYLKSVIYLREDYMNSPQKFITFETWLALLFDSGNYKTITKIQSGDSQGVLLKRQGFQSGGVLFKYDGGDLFPSYVANDAMATPITTPDEDIAASSMIIQSINQSIIVNKRKEF